MLKVFDQTGISYANPEFFQRFWKYLVQEEKSTKKQLKNKLKMMEFEMIIQKGMSKNEKIEENQICSF